MVENKIEFPKERIAPSDDECIWAMVCHLSCLFGGIVIPTVIYLLKRNQSAFIRHHAWQAMTYQGAVLLMLLISLGMLFPLSPLLVLIGVVTAVRARNGEWVAYPILRRWTAPANAS